MEELLIIEENNKPAVKDYDNVLGALKTELQSFLDRYLLITDDIELKNVKDYRTEIRKLKDKVKQTRDWVFQDRVGIIYEQCMTLEKEIDLADKQLKTRVDDYLDKDKQKVITLEIKSYNRANIDAVKNYAEKLGLVVKEK